MLAGVSEADRSCVWLHPTDTLAPLGFSQAFYREKLYEKVLGFKDLEDFMVNFWEAWALSKGKSRREKPYMQ